MDKQHAQAIRYEIPGLARRKFKWSLFWLGVCVVFSVGGYIVYGEKSETNIAAFSQLNPMIGRLITYAYFLPVILPAIFLSRQLSTPERAWIDERGFGFKVYGVIHINPWSSFTNVACLPFVIKRRTVGASIYGPSVQLTDSGGQDFHLEYARFGLEPEFFVKLVDRLLPLTCRRDDSFRAIATLIPTARALPITSSEYKGSGAKPVNTKGWFELQTLALILVPIGLGLSIEVWSPANAIGFVLIAMFMCSPVLISAIAGNWLKQFPNYYILHVEGIKRCSNGAVTSIIPWHDTSDIRITYVPTPRLLALFAPTEPSLIQIKAHGIPEFPIDHRKFSMSVQDLVLTIDPLLPESCVRDQSFLDCLARAKNLALNESSESEHA